MRIEEAIRHYEESEKINKELAKNCVSAMARNHNLENAEKCRQMIEWLTELQERRKQPERKVEEWAQVPRFEGDTQPDLECPFCKHKVGWWDMARYCAGCGAKLEGGAG